MYLHGGMEIMARRIQLYNDSWVGVLEYLANYIGQNYVQSYSGVLKAQYCMIRHDVCKGSTYTLNENISLQLAETKIKKNIPVKFLRPPMASCYLEFDKPENRAKSDHKMDFGTGYFICEGCYIQETRHTSGRALPRNVIDNFEIDPSQPVREMRITFTESPVGRHPSPRLDTCHYIDFYIQDEEESVLALVDRAVSAISNAKPFEERGQFVKGLTEALNFVAKVLFYIYVGRKETKLFRPFNEATELAKKIEGVADKKKRKLEQRLARTYDRIILGPEVYVPMEKRPEATATRGKQGFHYRSAYFGVRWRGTGQAKEAVLTHVDSYVVNPPSLTGDNAPIRAKEYEVR